MEMREWVEGLKRGERPRGIGIQPGAVFTLLVAAVLIIIILV